MAYIPLLVQFLLLAAIVLLLGPNNGQALYECVLAFCATTLAMAGLLALLER